MNTKYSSTPARGSRGAPPPRVRRVPPAIVVSAGALIGALAVLSSQDDAKATEYTGSPDPAPASSAAESPTARPDAPRAGRDEAEALRLVNEARAEHGCEPLRREARLAESARQHSRDLAARRAFAHRAPDRAEPGARTAAPAVHDARAESAAAAEPEHAVDAWMDSPERRADLLNCSFHTTGVGVAFDGKHRAYWTQDLARS
ncbi:CAP domain-containing protein [Streptomyces angustmyceticus]|uniref:CAP domain-containing protein n=1 Tax=Streptomyces angustmyceticus TaxID=285578 RepID=UPI00344CBFD1